MPQEPMVWDFVALLRADPRPFLQNRGQHRWYFPFGETHTVAGFGFAYAVSDRVIARIEYAHMDFGSETHNFKFTGGGPTAIKSDVDARSIRSVSVSV